MKYKVIILGSGPAGVTAALYAARADLKPLVLAGPEPGGQLTLTSLVENFPGFPDGILGSDLVLKMMDQAKRFGTEIVFETATKVDLSKHPFVIMAGGKQYKADCLIIAMGANAVWLGLESEQRLIGKGVSSCANCDGVFFRGKKVAVVGGGDAACEDALSLAKFASKVDVLVRGDHLKASKIMQERVNSSSRITVRFNQEVMEVIGEKYVTGLKIKNNLDNTISEEPVDGLFIAIGHKPNTDLFKWQLEIEPKKGYLIIGSHNDTNVPGVFVAGDVSDWRYRQAVTAAGEGCKAALEAEWWLVNHE
ncbi:MAG: thioredoxin-disulfide reductase [bacterium]